jgi:hypothetical protein
MPARLTIPPLDDATFAELRTRYDAAADADLRLRYQLVLLAHQGRSVAEIATITFRSRDTVERVLTRFRDAGLDAVPRHFAPGSAPTITPAWTTELLRVIDLDPQWVSTAPTGPPACGRPIWRSTPGLLSATKRCAPPCMPTSMSANARRGR